jgi:hypothetical protein
MFSLTDLDSAECDPDPLRFLASVERLVQEAPDQFSTAPTEVITTSA